MDIVACFLLFLTPPLSDFGIFSSGVSGTVASGVWLEVLSSDCPGGCNEVAVGVPYPHGIELPGKDSWLCGVQCGLAFSVAGGGAAGMIGQNVELGLGIKPEVNGRGVCGSGYIPLLLSFSQSDWLCW